MHSIKPIIISVISLVSIQALEIAKLVAPVITDLGQPVIVILTIIYMIKKIRRTNEKV